MSREIKFRAWSHEDKAMLDNDYLKDYSYHDILYAVANGDKVLMQYTGVKDHAGTDVYEGDIILWAGGVDSVNGEVISSKYAIVFVDGCFVGRGVYGEYESLREIINVTEIATVIGNIYENPELLEVNNQ